MKTSPGSAQVPGIPGSVSLGVPGAVPLEASRALPGGMVAAHFGSPLREQRDFARGRALVDLSHLGVVRVWGEDRFEWLNSLTTQLVSPPTVLGGPGLETLILSPTGRIDHHLRVAPWEDSLLLIVEPGDEGRLVQWLTSMIFMKRIRVSNDTGKWHIFAARTHQALVDHWGEPSVLWKDPWPGIATGGHAYATHEPGMTWDLMMGLYPREAGDAQRPRGGEAGIWAGEWAYEALRTAAFRPRFNVDTDEKSIPHEVDWLRTAVHLSKGCYRGQETVAKAHFVGHPPRRLTLLHLDGSEHELPPAGSLVSSDGQPVGRLGAAVLHYEQGPLALAVLKRTLDPDLPLLVGSTAASQQVVVPPDAGAVAGVPKASSFSREARRRLS